MHGRRVALGAALLLAAVMAGCGTSNGTAAQPAAAATASGSASSTAPKASAAPAPSVTGTYNVPPPQPGCDKPEPLLGNHCSGEAVSVPACLAVTSEQVAKALGYKGKVVISGAVGGCGYTSDDGTDFHPPTFNVLFEINYNLDEPYAKGLNGYAHTLLNGFPAGTQAWSVVVQGTPEVFVRADHQNVDGTCWPFASGSQENNVALCRLMAGVLLKEFPPFD